MSPSFVSSWHEPGGDQQLPISDFSYFFFLRFHRDEHKGKNNVPETKVGEDGTAKRNIQRKHDHDPHRKNKPQHGGAGGKGKWNDMDDGTIP